MVPISVGISGSLSAEQSPNRSIDGIGVPVNSVYCESESDDNLVNSTWESPTNGPVVRESIEIVQDEEIGSNMEDVFSDWLQSHSESGPAEAAVDSALFFRTDSSSLGSSYDDYNVTTQRPREPLVPIIPYSSRSLNAALVLSRPTNSLSSLAIQSMHEVEFDSTVAVLTSESLAESEVFTSGVGEHALVTQPSSSFEFDTGEDSKESYSAVLSNPVLAKSDSGDKYEVLAAPAPSCVRMATDPVCEESNRCSSPSLFSTSPLELHDPTSLPRDPQPSLFSGSPSSSLDLVMSLSILPSSLSVSLSSLSVPSSTLSSSRSSLFVSPASFDSFYDQVPPSRSISILLPFASVSDISLLSSSPAAAYREASGTYAHRLDVAESSLTLRPPEDPPPDVSDELRNWLHAYTALGIEERSLSSLSDPPSLPGTFDDRPEYLTPTDGFGTERRTVFLASRMTLLPAA